MDVKIKSEDKELNFLLKFSKSEEMQFVEYIPIKHEFSFKDEDLIFEEELELHKDDLSKMLSRFLSYKSKK